MENPNRILDQFKREEAELQLTALIILGLLVIIGIPLAFLLA